MGETDYENCICDWSLGMGPNLNCPVHGRPELQRDKESETMDVEKISEGIRKVEEQGYSPDAILVDPEKTMKVGKAVVLLSGGMDSAVCLAKTLYDGYEVYPLMFGYGQRHGIEIHCAESLLSHYGKLESYDGWPSELSKVIHAKKVFEIDLTQIGGSALTNETIDVPMEMWMAGVFDSEGSINLNAIKKTSGNIEIAAELWMLSKDKHFRDKFARCTKVGKTGRRGDGQYYWHLTNKPRIQLFLEQLLPHLESKYNEAVIMIEYAKRRQRLSKAKYTALDFDYTERLRGARHTTPIKKVKAPIPLSYVPGRNAIFLTIALAYAEVKGCDVVVYGANIIDYSGYPDCRPEFVDAMEHVAKLGYKSGVEGKPIKIATPIIRKSKKDIVELGRKLGVPFGLTWSCYNPQTKDKYTSRGVGRVSVSLGGKIVACGVCPSCVLRLLGFFEAGLPDPIEYVFDGDGKHCPMCRRTNLRVGIIGENDEKGAMCPDCGWST